MRVIPSATYSDEALNKTTKHNIENKIHSHFLMWCLFLIFYFVNNAAGPPPAFSAHQEWNVTWGNHWLVCGKLK